MKLFQLDGKKAIVTGCSRGIGKSMAIGLAEAGANIIGVSGSMNADSEVAKEVEKTGRKFFGYAADLGNRNSLYQFVKEVQEQHPQIDILINNAGIIMRKPAAEHSDEYWDSVLSVNLDAQFILAREIGKLMIQQGYGRIIFTCSLLSFQGGVNVPGYAASKGAVASLVRALANEWASKGVNVNGIAPGYISTDNTEALRNDPDRSRAIMERIPAGRWGNADDFKGPAVFLASEASAYVHGAILLVDGGWMGR